MRLMLTLRMCCRSCWGERGRVYMWSNKKGNRTTQNGNNSEEDTKRGFHADTEPNHSYDDS